MKLILFQRPNRVQLFEAVTGWGKYQSPAVVGYYLPGGLYCCLTLVEAVGRTGMFVVVAVTGWLGDDPETRTLVVAGPREEARIEAVAVAAIPYPSVVGLADNFHTYTLVVVAAGAAGTAGTAAE